MDKRLARGTTRIPVDCIKILANSIEIAPHIWIFPERLSRVLSRRDEIISDLAMLKPETTAKLQSIYMELEIGRAHV